MRSRKTPETPKQLALAEVRPRTGQDLPATELFLDLPPRLRLAVAWPGRRLAVANPCPPNGAVRPTTAPREQVKADTATDISYAGLENCPWPQEMAGGCPVSVDNE